MSFQYAKGELTLFQKIICNQSIKKLRDARNFIGISFKVLVSIIKALTSLSAQTRYISLRCFHTCRMYKWSSHVNETGLQSRPMHHWVYNVYRRAQNVDRLRMQQFTLKIVCHRGNNGRARCGPLYTFAIIKFQRAENALNFIIKRTIKATLTVSGQRIKRRYKQV